jgi:hypothetical protein
MLQVLLAMVMNTARTRLFPQTQSHLSRRFLTEVASLRSLPDPVASLEYASK